MHVEEPAVLKKLVNGPGQYVAHAKHGSESVGTGAQVSQGPQRFQVVLLFLQRVLFRVRSPVHHQGPGLQLDCLALSGRGHQLAFHTQTGAGGDAGDYFRRHQAFLEHYRALLQSDPAVAMAHAAALRALQALPAEATNQSERLHARHQWNERRRFLRMETPGRGAS